MVSMLENLFSFINVKVGELRNCTNCLGWTKRLEIRQSKMKIYRRIAIYWNYVDANFCKIIDTVGLIFALLTQIVGNYALIQCWGRVRLSVCLFLTGYMAEMSGLISFGVQNCSRPGEMSKKFRQILLTDKPTKYGMKLIASFQPLKVSLGNFTVINRNTALTLGEMVVDYTFTLLITF